MPPTHEYPTEQLQADREAGLLICRCYVPITITLPVWASLQCERCGRKVLS